MALALLENGQLLISSVVFATDLSLVSRNAGLYAMAIAEHFQAELTITHSFIPSQSAEEVEVLKQHHSGDRIERIARLKTTVAAFAFRDLRVRTQLLVGDPSSTIATFADSLPHSLLVLGTHGGSSLGRHLIGSVAERCLRRAVCPTLTVGPHVPPPDVAYPFHSMLYATDCSGMAPRAAPLACAMAGSFHSELKVISIIDEHAAPIAELLADLDFRTRKEIDGQLPGACDHFTESRAIAHASNARREILRYANSTHSDLLFLGVHRRRTIEILARNSVTIQIIAEASCPVLTLTSNSISGTPTT